MVTETTGAWAPEAVKVLDHISISRADLAPRSIRGLAQLCAAVLKWTPSLDMLAGGAVN